MIYFLIWKDIDNHDTYFIYLFLQLVSNELVYKIDNVW